MTLLDVQKIAAEKGVDVGGNKGKMELIHKIQRSEGHNPCFGFPDDGNCPYFNGCLWAGDCLGIAGIIRSCHTFKVVE